MKIIGQQAQYYRLSRKWNSARYIAKLAEVMGTTVDVLQMGNIVVMTGLSIFPNLQNNCKFLCVLQTSLLHLLQSRKQAVTADHC